MVHLALVGDASSINVTDWAKGLMEAGATVDLISFVADPSEELPVHLLTKRRLIGDRAQYVAAGRSIRCILRRIDPDVVVAFYVTGYGTVARLSRRHPLVQVSVGNDTLVNPPGTLTHYLARRNLRDSQLVVAWGSHIVDAVASFGVPRERILDLWGGIPLDGFPASRLPSDNPLALITTRGLDPYYRHDTLIRAVAASVGTMPTLTLVGSGPIRGELEALAGSLGVSDHVSFAGRVADDKKMDLLYANGLYVSACPTDGVSASLLEAMAAGLFPIVVDYVANQSWITDGANGLLVDGSTESFVSAFRRAADDPTLRARARAQNRELVYERGDLRRNSVIFVKEFQKLCSQR